MRFCLRFDSHFLLFSLIIVCFWVSWSMGLISLSLLADFAMDSFAAGGGVPGQLSFPPSFSSSDCLLPLQAGMRPSQGRGRGRGRSFQFVGTLPKNFRLLLLLDRIRLIFRRLHRWLLRLLVALCRLGVVSSNLVIGSSCFD
jgi:hypothetical protein